jgi:hypothetical protein
VSISLPFCSSWVEGARKNSGLSSRFLSTRTRTRIRLGLLFGRLADDPRPDVLKSVGCERRLRFSSELGAGGAPRSSVRPDRLSQTAHSDVVARRSINSESACWPEHLFRNRRPALPSPGSARLTLSLSCTRAKKSSHHPTGPAPHRQPDLFPAHDRTTDHLAPRLEREAARSGSAIRAVPIRIPSAFARVWSCSRRRRRRRDGDGDGPMGDGAGSEGAAVRGGAAGAESGLRGSCVRGFVSFF